MPPSFKELEVHRKRMRVAAAMYAPLSPQKKRPPAKSGRAGEVVQKDEDEYPLDPKNATD